MRRSVPAATASAIICSATLWAQSIPSARQLDPARGAVLAEPSATGSWGAPLIDSASHRVWSCSVIKVPSVAGVWIPSRQQIRSVEPILARVIAESLGARPQLPSINDYYRQYVGIVVGGRRLIFINGFHKSFFEALRHDHASDPRGRPPASFDWRRKQVQVCDGGEYYFGAVYDPDSATVDQFGFNGFQRR
jgi:hypothetical protein